MGFRQPVSVAVDDQGTVFVGDSRLGIVGLDPVKKKMWLFSKLSPEAPTLATGIAVDSKFVYATDANQSQVSLFDKEGRRLKTIGASRAQIRRAFLVEFGLLGATAGIVAAAAGTAAAWGGGRFVMRGEWVFLPGTLALTILLCTLLTLAFGYAGTALALRARPAQQLRNE